MEAVIDTRSFVEKRKEPAKDRMKDLHDALEEPYSTGTLPIMLLVLGKPRH